MMDESFAKSLQLELNAEVKFLTWGGLKNAKIVGLVKPSGVSGVTQGGIVITSLKTAQRWYKSKEKLDSISIVVKEGKSINSVKAPFKASYRLVSTCELQ